MSQVYVRSPNGKSEVANVYPTMTIAELKNVLNIKNMKISKGGRLLCDHQTIEDADIHNQTTLDAIPSLPGGGCSCSCRCVML
jgi:hypothetical protein